MTSTFPQADFHHIAELVILSATGALHHDGRHIVQAHVEEEHLFVIAFQGKDLIFFNGFSVKGETDILYFLLHSMDSLGIDYQDADIRLSGYNEEMDKVVEVLRSYCPQAELPDSENWRAEVGQLLSKHSLCAS